MSLSLSNLSLADNVFFPENLEKALRQRNVNEVDIFELVSYYRRNRQRTFLGLYQEYAGTNLCDVLEDIFKNEFLSSIKSCSSTLYTAHDANMRKIGLDGLIQKAVESSSQNNALLRIYRDDCFFNTIQEELEKRGFRNVKITLSITQADVYFEWGSPDSDSTLIA